MPLRHSQHQQWTPGRLQHWAQQLGPDVLAWVTHQLESRAHPEQAYRVCLGLLSLAKRYGNLRLEAACECALALGAYKYRHVRDVLANNRDRVAGAATSEWVSPPHGNLRGPGNYQ